MNDNPSSGIDEKDLDALRRAVEVLSKIGVSVSDLQFDTSLPGTEFEGPVATVACAFGSLGFGVMYEHYRLQTHLSAVITLFPEDQIMTPGDPRDITVEEFMAWLNANAPMPIEVVRSYGQLATDDSAAAFPDFPRRESYGGSVVVFLQVVMPWEQLESAILVDDVVVLGPDTAQDDQYAGRSLDDALSVFLDFMLRAQSLEMLPDGARWSRL